MWNFFFFKEYFKYGFIDYFFNKMKYNLLLSKVFFKFICVVDNRWFFIFFYDLERRRNVYFLYYF